MYIYNVLQCFNHNNVTKNICEPFLVEVVPEKNDTNGDMSADTADITRNMIFGCI